MKRTARPPIDSARAIKFAKMVDSSDAYVKEAYLKAAHTYLEVGFYKEAFDYYRAGSIPLTKDVYEKFLQSDRVAKYELYEYMADQFVIYKAFDHALQLYDIAILDTKDPSIIDNIKTKKSQCIHDKKLFSIPADFQLEKAEEFLQAEKFEEAIAACHKSLTLFVNREAYYKLGDIYFAQKDYNNSLINYKKSGKTIALEKCYILLAMHGLHSANFFEFLADNFASHKIFGIAFSKYQLAQMMTSDEESISRIDYKKAWCSTWESYYGTALPAESVATTTLDYISDLADDDSIPVELICTEDLYL